MHALEKKNWYTRDKKYIKQKEETKKKTLRDLEGRQGRSAIAADCMSVVTGYKCFYIIFPEFEKKYEPFFFIKNRHCGQNFGNIYF